MCKISKSQVNNNIVVQSLSCVRSFATLWTISHQAPLSQSLLKFMTIELVILSNCLFICCHLLLLLSIFPCIRVFSNESALCIRWTNIGASVSTTVLPLYIQSWFPLGLTGLTSLQSKALSRVFSNTTVQKHQFFNAKPSLWSNSHIHTWLWENP